MKAIVKHEVILIYGGTMQATVSLNARQKWEIITKHKHNAVLNRGILTIKITIEDYEKYFEEVADA